MISRARSATLVGIEALPVEIEVDLQRGAAIFVMVGLPDKAVQESQERVRTAIRQSELTFPNQKIICNLAPGDIRKEGPFLDLPIAAAILAGSGQAAAEGLNDTLFLGELSLDGTLRPVNGAVSVALLCRERGFKRLVLPKPNASEAAVVPELEVYGVENLLETVELMNGSMLLQPESAPEARQAVQPRYEVDFNDVKGQAHAVRALEIAAGGGHNALMIGPPGSGKTMLARRMPTILPPLSLDEAIEVTRIYSTSGNKAAGGLVWERSFRSPHHTSSYAAVVGGGKNPKPGEISLAHHGVLFMDEMPEFDRGVLEALRQPLEDGVISVARVQATLDFPAETILIGAMNPSPHGQEETGIAAERYRRKISAPLLDRIDLHLSVPKLNPEELGDKPGNEDSATIRARVVAARERQTERFGRPQVNAKMSPRELRELIGLDEQARDFMRMVAAKMNLSARVYDRVLKVGRTIADLNGDPEVKKNHLAEAVQYRGGFA